MVIINTYVNYENLLYTHQLHKIIHGLRQEDHNSYLAKLELAMDMVIRWKDAAWNFQWISNKKCFNPVSIVPLLQFHIDNAKWSAR